MADARLSLADALRRTGRVTDALVHYRRIFEADSSASQARFGYAIALVRLGRDAEAFASIEESVARFADQPGFSHALARLLAANSQGRPDLAQRLATNLRTYESRQPCRTPWTLDDPIHHPRPAA